MCAFFQKSRFCFIYARHTYSHHWHTSLHTLLVSCVSIMKLCTCFSALVSSSFLATTATTRAVQPAPWERGGREEEEEKTEHLVSKEEELVNRWLLAGELAQMIEGSQDKYEEGSCTTEGEMNGREERIKRDSSVPDRHFLMLRSKPSLFSRPIHLVWDPFYIASICSWKICPL